MAKPSKAPSPAKRSEPDEARESHRKSMPGHSKGDKHPVHKGPMKPSGPAGTWRPC